MQAGTLDRSIVIQRSTETQDAIGGVVSTWATLQRLNADVREMPRQERFAGARDFGVRSASFFTRYFEGLTNKDRIQFDSQTWDIIAIREIGRREGLEIMAEVVQ